MDVIVLGVNYASHRFARRFAEEWRVQPGVRAVYVVDNYSGQEERERLEEIARDTGATVMHRANTGYGSALNAGIDRILASHPEDALVLFGNVDVMPVSIGGARLGALELPEITVLQDGVDRNPFLTWSQRRTLPWFGLPLRTGNWASLVAVQAASRLLRFLSSRTWAVHGSMFAATTDQLRSLVPLFDDDVFLYCEELFFARKAERLGYKFTRVPIVVDHIGSVSTFAVKASREKFFKIWSDSMARYLRGSPRAP